MFKLFKKHRSNEEEIAEVLNQIKQKNLPLWQEITEIAALVPDAEQELKNGNDVNAVLTYLRETFGSHVSKITDDAVVIGEILGRLVEKFAEIGPLRWDIIPDYDTIINEEEIAFYLVIARDQVIIDSPSALYWYLTPKSIDSVVEAAIRIAKRARRLVLGSE